MDYTLRIDNLKKECEETFAEASKLERDSAQEWLKEGLTGSTLLLELAYKFLNKTPK